MACAVIALRRAGVAIFFLALFALVTAPSAAEVKWEGRAGSDTDTKSEAKIRKALADPTKMDFVETPLADAITYLKDLHSIEIQLDTKAMEEAGASRDTPITAQSNGISLASALRLILKPAELTYVVKDGVLMITTPDAASEMIDTRVYDVRDMIKDNDARELAASLETFLFPRAVGMGGMGGGMGGMGGGMGGMGGGMFAVNDGEGAKEATKSPSAPAVVFRGSTHITPYRHLLLVRASIVDHERLKSTLDEMREKLKPKG